MRVINGAKSVVVIAGCLGLMSVTAIVMVPFVFDEWWRFDSPHGLRKFRRFIRDYGKKC